MKRLKQVTAIALVALAITACKSTPDATIVNLKAAIDGESNASAKYAVFATNATEAGDYEIAALFQATTVAEDIHAKNHAQVLKELGVAEHTPVINDATVGTTLENLNSGITGETYEFETMYPEFIKVAEKENVLSALTSYMYANDTEKGHADLYQAAISNIANPEALAKTYHVCPKCGNTFAGEAPESCELCQTGADTFLVFTAQERTPETVALTKIVAAKKN